MTAAPSLRDWADENVRTLLPDVVLTVPEPAARLRALATAIVDLLLQVVDRPFPRSNPQSPHIQKLVRPATSARHLRVRVQNPVATRLRSAREKLHQAH